MQPDPLKFEFSPRHSAIPSLPPEAVEYLENRDRLLEDYLKNLKSGGAGIGGTLWSSKWGEDFADIDGDWTDFSEVTLELEEPGDFMVWALATGRTNGTVVPGTRITMAANTTFHIGPYATITPQNDENFRFELYTQGSVSFGAGTHTITIQVREEDGGTDFGIIRTELQVMSTTIVS